MRCWRYRLLSPHPRANGLLALDRFVIASFDHGTCLRFDHAQVNEIIAQIGRTIQPPCPLVLQNEDHFDHSGSSGDPRRSSARTGGGPACGCESASTKSGHNGVT